MDEHPPDPDQPRSRRRRMPWVIFGAVVLVAVVGAGYVLADRFLNPPAGADRFLNPPAGMETRAAEVMPFDLNATHHTFTKTGQGGIEEVVAIDAADARNIELIRTHLEYEAAKFGKGNFSDPARIHGMDMPGLRELEAGASRVEVRYESLPTGARITYGSDDAALIAALHAWFDRQSTDHGMPNMGG